MNNTKNDVLDYKSALQDAFEGKFILHFASSSKASGSMGPFIHRDLLNAYSLFSDDWAKLIFNSVFLVAETVQS